MKKKLIALALGIVACSAPVRAQDTIGTSEIVRRAIHVCNSCHGEEGRSEVSSQPSLAGQQSQYMQQQLKDFRSQTRSEANLKAYMWGVSALLDDATIAGLADYYAAQKPQAGLPGEPRQVAEGRKLYMEGVPLAGVRACVECHGANAEGQAGFPRLAGQYAEYIVSQLRVFKSTPLRPHGVLMKSELRAMTDAEIRAVAAYLQSR